MIRLLGVLLIFGSSGVCAVQTIRQKRLQLQTLEELLYALHRLEQEIRCEGRALGEIFLLLAEETNGQTGSFFERLHCCRKEASEELLFRQWESAASVLVLPEEGCRIWRELGRRLAGDGESIGKGLALAAEEFARLQQTLRRTLPEKSRVTAALCFSAAAFLSVLLL